MVRVDSRPTEVTRALIAGSLIAIAQLVAGWPASAEDVLEKLKARMIKEKEARRACKVSLCKAFANTSVNESRLTCDVTKTWLAGEIQQKYLGDRLSWPWGHAHCSAGIAIDQGQVAAVMTQPKGTLKLKKHDISCTLDNKDPSAGVAYTVKLSIQPTVEFEKGRAVKLSMGWANIEAPTLAQGAIWSATKLDQAFGVMSSGIKKEINTFIYEKCAEEGIKIRTQ